MSQRLDHYDILAEIGRGGFATVYRAQDTRLNRPVALKIIHGNHAQDEGFVTRFRQEAEIAANLHHPRLIPVYDYGDHNGQLYLVMRLIEGGTLRDYLQSHVPLPLQQAIALLQQIAAVLDFLHGKALIHRDVKPSNILLESLPSGVTAFLADFGLVRSAEKSLTLTDQVLGTPTYMAPEQVHGQAVPQTDSYALAVIAYEMLTGRPPFINESPDGSSPLQLMMAHANTPPPSPLQFRPELGQAVADVLLQGLAKQPTERYASATAFAAALQEIQTHQTRQVQQQQTLADLLAQIEPARQKRDWLQVQQLCVQVMAVDRTNPVVLNLLAESLAALQQEQAEEIARRRHEEQYHRALQAIEAEQWDTAVDLLQQLLHEGGNDLEIQEPLRRAEQGQRLWQWYQQAVTQMKVEAWSDAARLWVQLLEEQPIYRDGQIQLLKTVKGWLWQLDNPMHNSTQDASLKAGETRLWEKDRKVMVYVPAGEFLYGDNKERVYLDGFWIDKTPVTNAEFARFVQATGFQTEAEKQGWSYIWNGKEVVKADGASWEHPSGKGTSYQKEHSVIHVNWFDAQAYAEWAGKKLPTEQQWEKSARGLDGREYPWGDWQDGYTYANTSEAGVKGTLPVGQFSPQGDSPYGCVDIVGNVWEWVEDWYEKDRNRSLRGGSWANNKTRSRCTYRLKDGPYYRYNDVGFRLVLSL